MARRRELGFSLALCICVASSLLPGLTDASLLDVLHFQGLTLSGLQTALTAGRALPLLGQKEVPKEALKDLSAVQESRKVQQSEKKNRQTVHKKAKKVIEEFMVEEYKEYDSWGQDDDATSDSDTQPEAEAGAEAEADQSSVEDNEYDAWGRIQREALPTMDLYSMVQQQLGAAEDAEKGGRPTRKLLT